MPRLSVIVPTFNASSYIQETIASILNQSYQDYEILIQDNLSSDNTLHFLSSLKDHRVKISSEKDFGYIDAFSKAFRTSTGNYIVQCCASDGFLDANWFNEAINYLDKNPHLSLVWAFPRYMSEDGILGNVSYPWFRRFAPKPREYIYYWLNFGLHLPEGNFVVRRPVIESFFPMVENLAFEDLEFDGFFEFMVNFFEHGLYAAHLPRVANYGRVHKGSLTESDVSSQRAKKRFDRYQNQRVALTNRLSQTKYFSPNTFGQNHEVSFSKLLFYYVKIKWRLIHFFSRAKPFQ